MLPLQYSNELISRLGFIYPGLTLTKMVLWSSMTWMTMAVTMDDLMIFRKAERCSPFFGGLNSVELHETWWVKRWFNNETCASSMKHGPSETAKLGDHWDSSWNIQGFPKLTDGTMASECWTSKKDIDAGCF
jgi:hypothetical protein